MSGYLVVGVDGTLTHHPATPTSELIRQAVGGWWDMVRLPSGLMGWVNDDGHIVGLERNVVGSVLLMALGASHLPYAGPVAITGWHPDTEITGLPAGGDLLVRTMRDAIRHALAGGTDDHGFADAARECADWVREAPTPGITIVSLGTTGGEGR